MNNLHDLFLLMFNLSQMNDKAKVIELFHESLTELFRPHQFTYSEKNVSDSAYSEEISTRNFFYGYLLSATEPTGETKQLVQNAIQMLAVILDRINFEAELKNKVDTLESMTLQQLSKINRYVEELEIAKLASLNLIEDLKEEINERKQTELDLKRSEALLNETQRITKVGGWEYNVMTDQTYFSDEIFNIYGITKDKLLDPDEGIKYYHPDDRTIVSDCFTKAITLGEPYDLEVRFINANSENIWVRTAGKPVLENGKVVKVIGNLMDITERKKADENLEKQNEYVKMILDNFPIGIATNEIDSMKVTYMNRKFSEIYGWPEDDFPYIGNFFEKVFPDIEYRQQMQTRILEDLSSGEMERMNWDNLKIATKTGEQRIVHAFNIPLLNQNIMVSTVQDITERKKAELTLRESEGKFKTLVENIPQKVFMKDKDYKWIFINKNLADDLEITPEEALGKVDTDFFPPDLAAKYHADDERIISSGQTEEMEEKYLEKGEDRWINTVKTAIKDENNKVLGILGLSWDITDRKRAEEEIQNQFDELHRWYELTLDREGRVLELKQEVNKLLKQHGEALRYEISIPDNQGLE